MKVHFISIGGSVMHQLAIALHRKGYLVTGSDDEIFEPAAGHLSAAGLLPATIGWFPEKITANLDAVILGMHAKADNPELLAAQALGLPIYSFPEYIYQESQNKTRWVVGGSHGKTTTTSMIMHVLQKQGADFDYLVGARLAGFDQSVNISDAPLVVCEGDEYPASALQKVPKFHFLYPHVAILTGIAWDHINVFPTFPFYLQQFAIFIDRIQPGGTLIYNETDPVLKELVLSSARTDIHFQPYGVPAHTIENGVTHLQLKGSQGALSVFGEHNLLNAHAAFLALQTMGIGAAAFLQAMADFKGAAKRLELLAEKNGTSIYRDFAHAPSKVKATVAAVRQQFPERQLVVALELHTYSSLSEAFLSEYAGSLAGADQAVVFYAAHALALKRLPPLDPEKVKAGFQQPGLQVIQHREDMEKYLRQIPLQNVNILLMSSGNYDGLDVVSLAQSLIA